MKLGGYTVDVHTGGLPQRVESGFGRLFGDLVGATYKPIAYLGSKVVHGTNHAVLAEQNLITGKDIKNIVLIVLNEKPGDVGGETMSLVSIEPFISDMGGLAGGYSVAPTTNISPEAQAAFDKAFQGFLGSNIKPFALLATKVVKGIEYMFAAEMTAIISPVAMQTSDYKSVAIIKVFSDFSEIGIDTIIEGRPADDGEKKAGPLGYAFTWLAGSNWP